MATDSELGTFEAMAEAATILPDQALEDDLAFETSYLARVQNTADYGVFVNLTPEHGSDISGLVHQSRLPMPTRPEDYDPGDRLVVELEARKDNGDLAFTALAGEVSGLSARSDETVVAGRGATARRGQQGPARSADPDDDAPAPSLLAEPVAEVLATIRAARDRGDTVAGARVERTAEGLTVEVTFERSSAE
mgnify:CR=1 FL=1